MAKPVHVNSYQPVHVPAAHPSARSPQPAAGGSFAEKLVQARKTQDEHSLRFSNHAQKRLQARDIQLSDDGLARLSEAVEKAGRRGGRESLVLMDELAFIVNVPDRLVITAVDARSRGEGVFTQIDSVVIAGSEIKTGSGISD